VGNFHKMSAGPGFNIFCFMGKMAEKLHLLCDGVRAHHRAQDGDKDGGREKELGLQA
jgi:hypothetical protein